MGYREELKLSERLASLDLPHREDVEIGDADGLLGAIVAHGDSKGRYYADPRMLRRLFWWQDVDPETVRRWRDELVKRGDLTLEPIARNCYSPDRTFLVACIQNRKRFWRFAERDYIPGALRRLVFERDEYACVRCGCTENLSLDHVIPWSKGGTDTEGNLQTMCRSCNSSKGAKLNLV